MSKTEEVAEGILGKKVANKTAITATTAKAFSCTLLGKEKRVVEQVFRASKNSSTDKSMSRVTKAFGVTARTQVKAANKTVEAQYGAAIKKAKEIASRVYHAKA
jgi:hypothetical protein